MTKESKDPAAIQLTGARLVMAQAIRGDSWLHNDAHEGTREFRAFYNYVRNKTNAIPACAACSPEDLYFVVMFLDIWRGRVRDGLEPTPEAKCTTE